MKKFFTIIIMALAMVSCNKSSELCNVVFDYGFTSNTIVKSSFDDTQINDFLLSLNPADIELSLGGKHFKSGEEVQLYEGLYSCHMLYNPQYEDNWFGSRMTDAGFYIHGYTCTNPSFYINQTIEVVKNKRNYTLNAFYDCCAFIIPNDIDKCEVVYYFPDFTEEDFEKSEPYVVWEPKLSEQGNIRAFFLNEINENINNYAIRLHKDGSSIDIPLSYNSEYIWGLHVEAGMYYILDYNRQIDLKYSDWTNGNI